MLPPGTFSGASSALKTSSNILKPHLSFLWTAESRCTGKVSKIPDEFAKTQRASNKPAFFPGEGKITGGDPGRSGSAADISDASPAAHNALLC
jgi:hypothetical protein